MTDARSRPQARGFDPVTRIILASDRAFNRGMSVTRGSFEGIWLGLLDPLRLARVDEAYYVREGIYVNEAYNQRGLWAWERAAVEKYFPAGSRVVVTGAGAGREVLALLGLGYDALGFEPNERLAALGAELTEADGHGARILPSLRDAWPATARDFDAAVVGWGSYMLIPGRRRRVGFLRSARAALPAGAPVLLSFFVRRGDTIRFRVTVRLANRLRRLRRLEPVEMGDALEPNYLHYFTREEVEDELRQAGFDLLAFGTDGYGWAVGRIPGG